jgi:hypothetical protein
MIHGFEENGTLISLKSPAIPAGFEPATHGVERMRFGLVFYSDLMDL